MLKFSLVCCTAVLTISLSLIVCRCLLYCLKWLNCPCSRAVCPLKNWGQPSRAGKPTLRWKGSAEKGRAQLRNLTVFQDGWWEKRERKVCEDSVLQQKRIWVASALGCPSCHLLSLWSEKGKVTLGFVGFIYVLWIILAEEVVPRTRVERTITAHIVEWVTRLHSNLDECFYFISFKLFNCHFFLHYCTQSLEKLPWCLLSCWEDDAMTAKLNMSLLWVSSFTPWVSTLFF